MALRIAAVASTFGLSHAVTPRFLPDGPLNMGYSGGACDDTVVHAVKTGLNVVIWSFITLSVNPDGSPNVTGGPDPNCVANISNVLASQGLPTTHMISIGGWDAPHPAYTADPARAYAVWKTWNEQSQARNGWPGYDGIDWDLEGVDQIDSPDNEFSVACMDLVGQFSRLAKADGYRVSLVPPESYFDVSNPGFDLSLRHSFPDWHPTFFYHGRNAYAYLTSRYSSVSDADTNTTLFDWVAVQVYESYSRTCQNLTVLGQDPAAYLEAWAARYYAGWQVAFSEDPAVQWPSQLVSLAPSQFVVGLANGWADGSKSVLIMPAKAGEAYTALNASGVPPRGFVFWDIGQEGLVPPGQTQPLYMAEGINAFLHTRGGNA